MIQTEMLYKPSFEYIKKERFTGSYQGMRYLLEKKEKDGANVILACAWPEPLSFEKTEDSLKTFMEFEFSKDGTEMALNWLSEKQDEMCETL